MGSLASAEPDGRAVQIRITQPSIGRVDHVSVQCQSMRDVDIPLAESHLCRRTELAMILVTGATGNVGCEVANLLLASGEEVMAVTRNPAAAVLPDSAHVAAGDPSHPQTLTSVLRDVEAIFISPRPGGCHSWRCDRRVVESRRGVGGRREWWRCRRVPALHQRLQGCRGCDQSLWPAMNHPALR